MSTVTDWSNQVGAMILEGMTVRANRPASCPRPESEGWDGREWGIRFRPSSSETYYYTGRNGAGEFSPDADDTFRYCTREGVEVKAAGLTGRGVAVEIVRVMDSVPFGWDRV